MTRPRPRHRRRPARSSIDLDATLVTAHSEKEPAAPNYKRGFGFHPIGAWVDHGPDGTGEPLSMLLRPGNAGANTAADHIASSPTPWRNSRTGCPATRPAGAHPHRRRRRHP